MSSVTSDLLKVLEQHGAELYALLTRLTLRPHVAEDLLQDLFLRLQASPNFGRATNPAAYVFRTAMNLALDWRRSLRKSTALPDDLPGEWELPIDRMIELEALEQVLEALPELPELGRQIVVLRYLQHQDYSRIAEQLGKTEHQVRGLCHKALSQLRSMLNSMPSKPEKEGQDLR